MTFLSVQTRGEVSQINTNDKTGKKLINFLQIFQLAIVWVPSFPYHLALVPPVSSVSMAEVEPVECQIQNTDTDLLALMVDCSALY